MFYSCINMATVGVKVLTRISDDTSWTRAFRLGKSFFFDSIRFNSVRQFDKMDTSSTPIVKSLWIQLIFLYFCFLFLCNIYCYC